MDEFRRYFPLIGFIILAAFAVAGFSISSQAHARTKENAQRLEVEALFRANQTCEAQNDVREVLRVVLRSLAEERDGDVEGDFLERQALLAQVLPLIETLDCPPEPPDELLPE